ncbi:KamA family radical SAM protein [bacterium]|nr:KamA family radical SAM protein [candidate division CSSED10-310 bacterium]
MSESNVIWQSQLNKARIAYDSLLTRFSDVLAGSDALKQVLKDFPVKITPYYLDLINKTGKTGPIAKQVLPSVAELEAVSGTSPDPLHETQFMPVPGLLHKYSNRVLVLLTQTCAVHCRFCFRRHALKNNLKTMLPANLEKIADYIRVHKEVSEVILSGGDPLTLASEAIDHTLRLFSGIPHIRTFRIHTKIPAVLPERITKDLIEILSRYKTMWIVTHFNHPYELTSQVIEVCAAMINHGLPLLNQTVLLKNVNDNVDTLRDLFLGLIQLRIKPYYLHLLDAVAGASHFGVEEMKAVNLLKMLNKNLPGYAVPVLVKEIPGRSGKTPIF